MPDPSLAPLIVTTPIAILGITAACRILALAAGRNTPKARKNRKEADAFLNKHTGGTFRPNLIVGSKRGGPPGGG